MNHDALRTRVRLAIVGTAVAAMSLAGAAPALAQQPDPVSTATEVLNSVTGGGAPAPGVPPASSATTTNPILNLVRGLGLPPL